MQRKRKRVPDQKFLILKVLHDIETRVVDTFPSSQSRREFKITRQMATPLTWVEDDSSCTEVSPLST